MLYIRDVATTKRFYTEVMGFETMIEDPGGQFLFMRAPLSQNHHDIAFFAIGQGAGPTTAGRSSVGMYHIAWEVGTLEELEETARLWLAGPAAPLTLAAALPTATLTTAALNRAFATPLRLRRTAASYRLDLTA